MATTTDSIDTNPPVFDDIYIDGKPMNDISDLESGTTNTDSDSNKNPLIPHPISVFFHLFFKFLALFIYLIIALLVESFALVFILVVLCLAADFWTVKNVTGRLLVGMRYWNEIRDDGSNEWFFESLGGKRKISKIEAAIFWIGLLLFPLIWLLLGILAIFEMDPLYLIVVFVAFILSTPNIYGYILCAKDTRFAMKKMASDYVEDKAKDYAKQAAKDAVTDYAKNSISSISSFNFGKE